MLVGSIREARAYNGNIDWKCGHCKKTNFARVVVCSSCHKSIDGSAEYLDGAHKSKQRYQNMMRLAKAKGVLG